MSDTPPITTIEGPAPDQEFADRQRLEYGRYRATQRINVGGALAFKPGDAVPAGHVERGVVREDQVELVEGGAVAFELPDEDAPVLASADYDDDQEV